MKTIQIFNPGWLWLSVYLTPGASQPPSLPLSFSVYLSPSGVLMTTDSVSNTHTHWHTHTQWHTHSSAQYLDERQSSSFPEEAVGLLILQLSPREGMSDRKRKSCSGETLLSGLSCIWPPDQHDQLWCYFCRETCSGSQWNGFVTSFVFLFSSVSR